MFANCDRHTETEAPNSERRLPESTGMSPLSLVPEVSILEGAAWEENYSPHRRGQLALQKVLAHACAI